MPSGEPIGPELIRRLLLKGEGNDVDFKQEQYPFPHGPEPKRAEILKDILAFANAWRTDDAYILIGVGEDEQKRPVVLGTEDHFNPADLQQYVNANGGKLNRPADFHYVIVDLDGKRIGVLHVPLQNRPLFAKKNMGFDPVNRNRPPTILENTVYYRRGDSTFIATPDETIEMFRADSQPVVRHPALELEFADPFLRTRLGLQLNLALDGRKCVDAPRLEGRPDMFDMMPVLGRGTNADYYRELVAFVHLYRTHPPVGFTIRNTGTAVASNVVVELPFEDAQRVTIIRQREFPHPPRRSTSLTDNLVLPPIEFDGKGIHVEKRGHSVVLLIHFGRVQAGQQAFADEYVHLMPSGLHELTANIRADELAQPVSVPLEINSTFVGGELPWSNMKVICEKTLALMKERRG